MTVGILLAAGKSSRFRTQQNTQKLLARLPDNRRVVEASATHLLTELGRVIAVTSHDEELMLVLAACGCEVVVNARAGEGMGTSIAAGVNASLNSDSWIIALGDMPYVRAETIGLVRQHLLAQDRIVMPMYQGKRGHPVGFARAYGNALCGLQGDAGAKSIIAATMVANASWVMQLDVDDPGVLADIDAPVDLR